MQTLRARSAPVAGSVDAVEAVEAAEPAEPAEAPDGIALDAVGAAGPGGPGGPLRKVARLARGLGEWATQQVTHENAHLRAQVARLQAEIVFWREGCGPCTDPLDGVCMVQDFNVPAGGFPHQYVPRAGGGDGADVVRFVSARKLLRISGRLLARPGQDDARRATPVNASVFGPDGVLYAISFVDASSGESHTLQHYPGAENGMPFLEWPNGDRARDHFRVGPDESAWTVCFRFPHVPRDRKDRVEWRLRFAPKDEPTRQRYPGLTFETATFRACARVKDE